MTVPGTQTTKELYILRFYLSISMSCEFTRTVGLCVHTQNMTLLKTIWQA